MMEVLTYRIYRELGKELIFKGYSLSYLAMLLVFYSFLVFLYWVLHRLGVPFLFLFPVLAAVAFLGTQNLKSFSRPRGLKAWKLSRMHDRQPRGFRAVKPESYVYPNRLGVRGQGMHAETYPL